MSIEEMIDKGYTMNEILDSVSEIWEKKVAQNERETKKREAREKLANAYVNYLKTAIPEFSDEDADKAVQSLEESLEDLEKTVTSMKKLKDKLDAKIKNCDCECKKPINKEIQHPQTLKDFLDKMGWQMIKW